MSLFFRDHIRINVRTPPKNTYPSTLRKWLCCPCDLSRCSEEPYWSFTDHSADDPRAGLQRGQHHCCGEPCAASHGSVGPRAKPLVLPENPVEWHAERLPGGPLRLETVERQTQRPNSMEQIIGVSVVTGQGRPWRNDGRTLRRVGGNVVFVFPPMHYHKRDARRSVRRKRLNSWILQGPKHVLASVTTAVPPSGLHSDITLRFVRCVQTWDSRS